ncbi:MAG: exosortase F system-associated protein [Flavobacteriaceae bacterium]|nr:exosortase F system-associated protein [Flavobacteriaceae bacterium]
MDRIFKYIIVSVLILLLVLIRFFENDLFYDPYLTFFKNDYLYLDSPRREVFKLTLFTSLRYVLNSMISMAILFVVFRDKGVIKFSAVVYLFAYIMLLVIFLYFVINPRQEDYYLFFNLRRFLIQPLILLILLPAFYYNKVKV